MNEMEEESPLTPNSRALILCNLFRKESNGDPIDFYYRRSRFINHAQKVEFNEKYEKLKAQIEECGGCLNEEPFSCFSIELVFPEIIDNPGDVDSDMFNANFVEESVNCLELLDIENFRIGQSPYGTSANINEIMKGFKSWDSMKRPSPFKGRKLPDFGLPSQTVFSRSPISVKQDKLILAFIIENQRYSDLSGKQNLWKDIQESVFSGRRTWQSIRHRFQRVIMKDLDSKEYDLDPEVIRNFRKVSMSQSSTSDDEDSSDLSMTESLSASKSNKYKSVSSRKPRPYTLEEDRLIIDYIVKKSRYEEVRGKKLWVDIQDRVLHEYERSWESAKNRFLKTIVNDLSKYRLPENVIEQIRLGITAERQLGGRTRQVQVKAKKRPCRVIKESEDESPVKHPALLTKNHPTPMKQHKRQLYKQPAVPLPIVFTPQAGPSVPRQTTLPPRNLNGQNVSRQQFKKAIPSYKKSNSVATQPLIKVASNTEKLLTPAESVIIPLVSPAEREEPSVVNLVAQLPSRSTEDSSSVDVTLPTSSVLPNESSIVNPTPSCTLPPKLVPAPSMRCSVVLKRLTRSELEKYGCQLPSKLVTHKPNPTKMSTPSKFCQSSPKPSRFTVEISPSLLADRLSTVGSAGRCSDLSTIGTPKWLPLSISLSRQCLRSIRQTNQSLSTSSPELTSSTDDQELLDPVSTENPVNSSITLRSTTELIQMRDERVNQIINSTAVTRTQKSLSLHSRMTVDENLDVKKDDGSSDGDFHTPCNTDGYRTPDAQ